MTSKIDKIRRKLQQNRKKAILQNLTLNQNISNLLYTMKPNHTQTNLKKNPFLFAISPQSKPYDASTDQSDRSCDFERPNTFFNRYKQRQTHDSVCSIRRKISHSQWKESNLTTKSLNPSIRLKWKTQQIQEQLGSHQQNQKKQIVNSRAVVIVNEFPSQVKDIRMRKSIRITIKKPSLMDRKRYFQEQEEVSPTRKIPISAWETSDDY